MREALALLLITSALTGAGAWRILSCAEPGPCGDSSGTVLQPGSGEDLRQMLRRQAVARTDPCACDLREAIATADRSW
jgi:hypothetical protein